MEDGTRTELPLDLVPNESNRHTDGAQLLFAAPPEPDLSVQLIVIASQFDVHLVGDPLPTDLTGGTESDA